MWLGNVSALTDQKDYPTLLNALHLLKRENHNFICLIAGDGHLKKTLLNQTKELGLSDCVKFLGFRKDVPNLLQALDVLAIPSKFEGLGTVILDSLQAGCAISSTKTGGIPEIIDHGKSGLLCEVGDYSNFAVNLQKLIESENLRKLYGETGRLKVQEQFSVEQMVEGNIASYKKF